MGEYTEFSKDLSNHPLLNRKRRVMLLAGHYGSGKTNIALNMAYGLKDLGKSVTVADLDIVNPYYRLKDSEKELSSRGIDMISSSFANSNVDLPSLPQELYRIVDDTGRCFVVDVGGDDRGAYALGRFSGRLKEENSYDMLLVVNCYRPLSGDGKNTLEIKEEIEAAGHVNFTAVINNSNLGVDTTPEDIRTSREYAEEIASLTGLPLLATTVRSDLYCEIKDEIDNAFPLCLSEARMWQI